MKRIATILLVLVVLLAGCAVEQTPEETGPKRVSVSTVDEFLAAIGPDTEIVLEPGIYDLSEAADYGSQKEDGFYDWEGQEDGWQLVITGVENLTIRGGTGEDTTLRIAPAYANVLTLQNCSNLVLENFTAGRSGTEEPGGGLDLLDCTNVLLKDICLSGCGTVGLQINACMGVVVQDSEITNCGFIGIQAEGTKGLSVGNCMFRELGTAEYGGGKVFRLNQCSNVEVSGCEITDNTVSSLIDCYPCDNVVFERNSFARNQVMDIALDVDSGMIFDNNLMESNNINKWFSSDRTTVLDGIGKSWNEEMLSWYYSPPVESAPEGERTQVHVKTTDELLAAIAPNTEIILDAEFYDLSAAKDYGTGYSDYYYWNVEFDGPSLVITDVDNLVIRSENEDEKACTISAVPRYAHVLSFRRCSNITLSGFTAGHTVEPGYCMGGVLYFRDCDNMLVDNCGLYGCGILGVQAELSGMLTVQNCDIYECSYGGIQMSEVAGVVVENCTFRDLGGDSMSFYDCKDVTVDGKAVAGNAHIN